MIDKKYLEKYAVKSQTRWENVLREYAQSLFLDNFYRQKHSEQFLFKGGTALRLVFRSPRYSEDLDFSATGEVNTFEDLLLTTGQDLQKIGVEPEIETAQRTTGGYLAKLQIKLYDQNTPIMVNVSQRRKWTDTGEQVFIAGDYLPPFNITILKKELLTGEKLEALLDRSKPRDFYDLYFLLRANMISGREKGHLKKVLPLLAKTKINFAKELKIFLPQTHWLIISDFKKILKREIEQTMGSRV